MKKINAKVTVFSSVIALAVVVLLLNLVVFRKTEDSTVSCTTFLPEECPQKIGCSFCAEDYDYVEDADTVEQLWQEFVQLSGEVTSDPIPPEEMVEGGGYFQFVYADGETYSFRYASEEQGLWIGGEERCLVDGKAFYDWQERLTEAAQK